MRLCASVIAIAILSPLSALAEEAPAGAPPAAPPGAPPAVVEAAPPPAAPAPAPAAAAPAAPAAPAKTWKDLITIDGLVDSYYMYNLAPPSGPNNSLTPPGGYRSFDVNSNTFTLNYAKIGIGMSADNVALRMDLGYGAMGNVINGFPGPGIAPMGVPAAIGSPFVAQQAFVSLTPVTNFTVDLGKFATTAGSEVIEANKNWLYSRSMLFFNIPLVHTGLRLNYKVNDMVSVQGSVVNGWNGQGFEVDGNSAKTFGLNATITLPGGIGIIPTIYVGKENGSTSTRFLGDLVATYTMGALGLNLNFDYIKDSGLAAMNLIDPFLGVALMAHYTVSDHMNVTGRFEYAQLTATNGGTAQKNEEVTVGLACPFAGHLEVRPELRADFASPSTLPGMKSSQFTALVAGLAYF
ncbi:MAG TPA: outer membrane beta-barrel protein [Polyangia bacterium]|nr:outer membrane beta-barrel protein [Polyangia bacterium]